ncbi:MAG: serine hydrolase domain-containing protein, partial [Candidatus Dormibacteria bacterium]
LYLQQGSWQGRQVVPAAWVAAATSWQIRNGDGGASDWAQGYGYQFWRCRHGIFRGDGAFGQFCIVMPEQDAVVAITSGTGNLQGVLDCVWENVLPAMAAGGDAGQDAALADRLSDLTLAPQTDRPGSGATLQGEHRLEANPAGLESVSLAFSGELCRVTLLESGHARTVDCGFGHWRAGVVERAAGQGPEPCAGLAAWEEDGSLRLDWYFVRTPFGRTLRVRPVAAGVEVEHRPNVGEHARGLSIRGN